MPSKLALAVAASAALSAATAYAQTTEVFRQVVPMTAEIRADVVFSDRGTDRTNVITRILSLDVDGDDRVSRNELPERMHDVMTRGDSDRDGFLSVDEVRRLVNASSMDSRPVNFSVQRKATKLTDVINDLRLPHAKHAAAMADYGAVRNVNNPRSIDAEKRHQRMRELLDTEEYDNFRDAAARIRNPGIIVN